VEAVTIGKSASHSERYDKMSVEVSTMTDLLLELAPDLYGRLQQEAERMGKPLDKTAQELLAQRLADLPSPVQKSEKERVREALRAGGLLTELGPEMKKRARQATMSLDEVRAALDRAGGEPLSETILEMRGPKE
jgi:ParB-like chromosome segregation protein Spo0J